MGMADEMRGLFVDEETSSKFEQRHQQNLARRTKGTGREILDQTASNVLTLGKELVRARMYGHEAEQAGRNVAREAEDVTVTTSRTRTVFRDEQPQSDDDGMSL